MVLKLAVLISGGGSNLKALLDATEADGFPARIACVGSDTDAPGLDHAREAGVPTFIVRPDEYASRAEWGVAFAEAICEHGIDPTRDLVVSAGLMRILPPDFVARFSPRLINTHPALLPSFPGAHAVRDALAAGAMETGATVHVVDDGVDTGPVLRQERVEVRPDDTEASLHERIKDRERPLLVRTVRDIATGDLTLPAPVPIQIPRSLSDGSA